MLWANLDADGPLFSLLLHAQMLLDASGNAYLAASTLFEMAVCKVHGDGSSAWTATMSGSGAKGIALGSSPGTLLVVGGMTARLLDNSAGIGSSYCIGALNSTGAGAAMVVHGSAFVADNDVLLVASGLPPNKPGVFLFAPNQAAAPFGDGFLCLGAPIRRVPSGFVASSLGMAQRVLDLTTPPAVGVIVPGIPHNFQAWYRDPQGPGGSAVNLSDGYQVLFR